MTGGKPVFNQPNIFLGEFTGTDLFTPAPTENLNGVDFVLARSNIFKVFHSIISLVSVFMVYLKTIWTGTNKYFGNKLVNPAKPLLTFNTYAVDKITTRKPNGFTNTTNIGTLSWPCPSESTKIANFVNSPRVLSGLPDFEVVHV